VNQEQGQSQGRRKCSAIRNTARIQRMLSKAGSTCQVVNSCRGPQLNKEEASNRRDITKAGPESGAKTSVYDLFLSPGHRLLPEVLMSVLVVQP
jgi:hypothetical protein